MAAVLRGLVELCGDGEGRARTSAQQLRVLLLPAPSSELQLVRSDK